MRLWKDCAYFRKENKILRCTHPRYRKEFDGSFQCEGKCFRYKKDNIKSKNDTDELFTNGGDHVL